MKRCVLVTCILLMVDPILADDAPGDENIV
ncbi:uncharacterized protein METZ01_LOCUS462924, partial [marine metagenome]